MRLDPGEEAPRDLLSAAERIGLDTASVSGIGAVDRASLAYFDIVEKRYLEIRLEEPLEVVSLLGNLCIVEGRPFVHAHMIVSRRSGETLGGHLVSARVSVTLEIVLARIDVTATRRFDPRWGLKLLEF